MTATQSVEQVKPAVQEEMFEKNDTMETNLIQTATHIKTDTENLPPSPLQENQNKSSSDTKSSIPSSYSGYNVSGYGTGLSSPQISAEQQLIKAKKDLESMVLKYAKSERENLQNKNKVDELDKKLKRVLKDNDQLAHRIKLLTSDKSHLTDTLNAKVAQLTVLEQKNSCLSNVQGVKLKESEERIRSLELTNEELLKQIESYKSKEGELLDFSERLSMKHMMLQSELEEALRKLTNYKNEFGATENEKEESVSQNETLARQLSLLSDELDGEREISKNLRQSIEDKEVQYRRKIDELENEVKVMRRKHQVTTRELFKEIKQLKSQLTKETSSC